MLYIEVRNTYLYYLTDRRLIAIVDRREAVEDEIGLLLDIQKDDSDF